MSSLTGMVQFGGWTYRSTASIDREIDDELSFHIECKTQDLIVSGMSPEQAMAEANTLFGTVSQVRRQCQKIKYGYGPLMVCSLSISFVALIASIGWLTMLLNAANLKNQQMSIMLTALESPNSDDGDLVGEIVDATGKPLADAKIFLIHKSWPDGRYQQESHAIARNLASITVPDGSVDYSTIVPMGHHVHQKLGDDVFTIGFTAADGEAGPWFTGSHAIGKAPSGTLEDICTQADLENAIVPLRNLSSSGEWLNQRIFARPLGYTWMQARWSDHFDAMVFQKKMTSATANR